MNSTEVELSQLKHDMLISREQYASEKGRREKELDTENQRLKSQLQFKVSE